MVWNECPTFSRIQIYYYNWMVFQLYIEFILTQCPFIYTIYFNLLLFGSSVGICCKIARSEYFSLNSPFLFQYFLSFILHYCHGNIFFVVIMSFPWIDTKFHYFSVVVRQKFFNIFCVLKWNVVVQLHKVMVDLMVNVHENIEMINSPKFSIISSMDICGNEYS